jgi:hypothetical protein
VASQEVLRVAASLAVPQVRADTPAEVAASEAAGTPEAAVAAEVIANCFRVATPYQRIVPECGYAP